MEFLWYVMFHENSCLYDIIWRTKNVYSILDMSLFWNNMLHTKNKRKREKEPMSTYRVEAISSKVYIVHDFFC
jgi:hypothetical protein